jgi:hypothetical protein
MDEGLAAVSSQWAARKGILVLHLRFFAAASSSAPSMRSYVGLVQGLLLPTFAQGRTVYSSCRAPLTNVRCLSDISISTSSMP